MIRWFYYNLLDSLGGDKNFFMFCLLVFLVGDVSWLYVNIIHDGDISPVVYTISDIGLVIGLAAGMMYFGAVVLAIVLTPVVWIIEKRLEKRLTRTILAP